MTDPGGGPVARLRELSDRLEAITAALESGRTTDAEAGELAAEAAGLATEAAREAAAVLDNLDQG